MKKIIQAVLLICTLVIGSSAFEIEMRDGEIIQGELLWESSGKLILKSGTETVTVFKRSLARIDTIDMEGKRSVMLGEEYILRDKNEIIYFNTSSDSLTIRFRESDGWRIITEKHLAPNDTVVINVPNGEYLETVRFWRPDGVEYFSEGVPFIIDADEKSFERYEFEMKGYEGDTYPTLSGPKRAFQEGAQ